MRYDGRKRDGDLTLMWLTSVVILLRYGDQNFYQILGLGCELDDGKDALGLHETTIGEFKAYGWVNSFQQS
jgi:hypothetical protein